MFSSDALISVKAYPPAPLADFGPSIQKLKILVIKMTIQDGIERLWLYRIKQNVLNAHISRCSPYVRGEGYALLSMIILCTALSISSVVTPSCTPITDSASVAEQNNYKSR